MTQTSRTRKPSPTDPAATPTQATPSFTRATSADAASSSDSRAASGASSSTKAPSTGAQAHPAADTSLPDDHPAGAGVIVLLVVTALFVLTQLYLAIPLLPHVAQDFGASSAPGMVPLLLASAFSLTYAGGFLLWGPVSDQYGRRPVMLTGLVVLATVTLGCALVPNLSWLGGLRAAQGLAAASFAPVALAYLIEATPPRLRATAIGAMSTAFLVAGIFGQVLAGWIALHWHWSGVFLVTGICLGVMVPSIALTAREPRRAALHGHLGHRFAAMARLLARPAIVLLSCAHVSLLLSFVAMYTALGPHLQALGLAADRVILVRLAGLPLMFVALLAGPLAARIRMSGVACAGFALAAAGLALEAGLSRSLPGIVAGSLVFVTGVALAIPAMIVLYGTLAAPDRAAGMALNGFVLFVGASIGPVLAGRVPAFGMLLTGLAVMLLVAAGCVAGSARVSGQRHQTMPNRHRQPPVS